MLQIRRNKSTSNRMYNKDKRIFNKKHALLDTGCTHVIINEKIILKIFITLAEKPMTSQKIDESLNRYANHLSTKAKKFFYDKLLL